MKKTNAKTVKKTVVPVKKAPAKTVKKPAAVVPKPVVVAAKKVVPVVKEEPVVKVAPAVKPTSKPLVTAITAEIDIGFGNALFIRGEGPGLSWEKGIVLDCVGDSQWTLTLPETATPIVYKLLVNDLSWSTGPDYVAQPGSSVTVVPSF